MQVSCLEQVGRVSQTRVASFGAVGQSCRTFCGKMTHGLTADL